MPKLHADASFGIGKRHARQGMPCQDYAAAKSDSESAIICLSDGCSSGGKTDVGSRVMCLSTIDVLYSVGNAEHLQERLREQYQDVIHLSSWMMGLVYKDFLATSAFAYVSEKGGVIHYEGDGAIAIKYQDGRTKVYVLDWADSLPYYPLYSVGVSGYDLETFRKVHENAYAKRQEVVNEGEEAQEPFKVTVWESPSENEPFSEISASYPFRGEHAEHTFTLQLSSEELEGIESIALFSDGIFQVENLDTFEPLGWQELIPVLMKKRRMNSGDVTTRRLKILDTQLARRFKAEAIQHPERFKGFACQDDLSFALIHFDPEN